MFLQNTNAPVKVFESASQVTNVAYSLVDNLVKSVIGQLPYIASGIIVLGFFWLLSKGFRKVFGQPPNGRS